MKKILVPIKRVPDWQIKVKIASDNSSIDPSNLKYIINTFDEIAVEEAVRIKESKSDVEVVLLCIGPEAATEQIRSALAMGADKAIHIVSQEEVDSKKAAGIICEVANKDQYDLIIMGKQAIDSDSGQAPQRIAETLGLPQATFASKVEIDEGFGSAKVVREVDGGLETLNLKLPAIVSTDLRLNEPRLRSLPNIVAAKKKPLETIQISELSGTHESGVRITHLEYPPERAAGKKVESVDELVKLLREEAKVI